MATRSFMEKILSRALSFFIFVSPFALPQAMANSCRLVLEDKNDPLPSVAHDFFKVYKDGYQDSYESAEHLARFWKYHERFGIVRTSDNRIVLIAKTETMGHELTSNLKKAFNSQESATPIQLPQVKEGFAFDITRVASPMVRKLHETYMAGGTNCWNLCLRTSRIDNGLHETQDSDFRFWLDSPFAKRVTSSKDLYPGDIIAWVLKTPDRNAKLAEVHGAVYVAPGIVFSKNGAEESKPYRLMDIDEVFSIYMGQSPYGPALSNHFQFYRIRPLQEILSDYSYIIPTELAQAYAKLREREIFLEKAGNPDSELTKLDGIKATRAFRPVAEELTLTANQNLAALEKRSDLRPVEMTVLKTLWRGVLARLQSVSR